MIRLIRLIRSLLYKVINLVINLGFLGRSIARSISGLVTFMDFAPNSNSLISDHSEFSFPPHFFEDGRTAHLVRALLSAQVNLKMGEQIAEPKIVAMLDVIDDEILPGV